MSLIGANIHSDLYLFTNVMWLKLMKTRCVLSKIMDDNLGVLLRHIQRHCFGLYPHYFKEYFRVDVAFMKEIMDFSVLVIPSSSQQTLQFSTVGKIH